MSLTVNEVAGLQTTKYFNVAGIAILIFDYLITLEEETQLVWGRSWDVTRFVFTTSRYLPFVGMVMTAYSALRPSSDPCSPGMAENIIHILGVVAAEVLLILRTYAFWQGDKRVLYGLLVYGLATIVGAVAINISPMQLIPGGQAPSGLPCLLIASRNSTLVYLLLLVFEIVILLLTVYKRFRAYRQVNTSIVRTLYRDGMFYVACIILITLANVLVDGLFPFQFSDLLDLPQIALHSVLASRIMFSLRKGTARLDQGTSAMSSSSDLPVVSEIVCRARRPESVSVSESESESEFGSECGSQSGSESESVPHARAFEVRCPDPGVCHVV